MDPDQTAPWEQSDLSSYCLQYRLPKNIEQQTTKVVNCGLRVMRVYFRDLCQSVV